MVSIITWEKLKIFILDSSTSFSEEGLCFMEEMQSNSFFTFTKVHNSNIIMGKRAIYIGNNFGGWHLLILCLYTWEMEKFDRFFDITLMELVLSFIETINHKKIDFIVFVGAVFAFPDLI